MTTSPYAFQLFSTCPQSSGHADGSVYLEDVRRTAAWADDFGYTGMLIYSDHGLVDPWLVAAEMLQATKALHPLVAVQPANMHPHSVAKLVASLSYLYDRRIYLNMIAGGFAGDLTAIGDLTPHDDRYDRLREYTEIIVGLTSGRAVSLSGDWYTVEGLSLSPQVPEHKRPGVMMSGSSPAGLATAIALGATAVQYPRPASEQPAPDTSIGVDTGIRVGIVARDDAEAAWRVAHDRFPPTRRGQILHEMAMQRSDSQWHATLSELAEESARQGNAYWLGPVQNYSTFCPYLVGSYDDVAVEVARYWAEGHRTVILDIPPTEDEFGHTAQVFERAATLIASRPEAD